MYCKWLSAKVKAFFKSRPELTYTKKFNFTYLYGDFPFIKLRLLDIENRLESIAASMSWFYSYTMQYSYNDIKDDRSKLIAQWKGIENDIARYEFLIWHEYDDKYIEKLISIIRYCGNQSHKYEYSDYFHVQKSIDKFLSEEKVDCKFKSFNEYLNYFENFLSPANKETTRKTRETKENKAYKEELTFWKKYVELLKAGKAKEALAFLKTAKTSTEAHRNEAYKFKKGLIGVKYTGNVNSLNPTALAKLTTEKL